MTGNRIVTTAGVLALLGVVSVVLPPAAAPQREPSVDSTV
ncbi:hypothetical protein BJ969_003382 [Saccharopolyspora gloriosae]|uniref:Uncharacterized protein n=1 Tax=Saccharopolyspora gloriosae TaxID=455344 RepID=A0A840NFB8_9PSEU|nr:hypothetical protein [Saccharopolyspora gloriosae]